MKKLFLLLLMLIPCFGADPVEHQVAMVPESFFAMVGIPYDHPGLDMVQVWIKNNGSDVEAYKVYVWPQGATVPRTVVIERTSAPMTVALFWMRGKPDRSEVRALVARE
jgi:hypothetical protein